LTPSLDVLDASSEWYKLEIGNTGDAKITGATAFAVLHAFETLAQLIQFNASGSPVIARVPLTIQDSPRYAWRGLMIDVSRHFLPIWKLQNAIDAMAALKLNVLHLHISDAQSFPLALANVPQLSKKSVYSEKAFYSSENITSLISYARMRGVLIVPEVDMPGHSFSWRAIDEDVVANCTSTYLQYDGYPENKIALNPASNATWTAIDTLINDIGKLFGSRFFHVGGDEVVKDCWKYATQAVAINKFMSEHGLADYAALERYFDQTIQQTAVKHGKTPIVWDESFSLGNLINNDIIVQAWHSKSVFQKAVKAGYRTIGSFSFYLDRESPVCSGSCDNIYHMFSWTYRDFYGTDFSADMGFTPEEEKRILGGEAAIWAEFQDPASWDFMAVSRLGAIAERLWSPASYTDPNSFERRSQQQRCLMVRRGIALKSGPLSADYCETRDMFQ